MASQVDICNAALHLIGAQPIVALTDANDRARVCALAFPQQRDAVLRALPWNFAITRSDTLAAMSPAPTWGFAFRFQLPSDPYCLRVLGFENDEAEPWRVEGRTVLTDVDEIKLIYIARITDSEQFDPAFLEALKFKLASELAFPITGKASLSRDLLERYEHALGDARTYDSQESSVEDTSDLSLVYVRHGAGGSPGRPWWLNG